MSILRLLLKIVFVLSIIIIICIGVFILLVISILILLGHASAFFSKYATGVPRVCPGDVWGVPRKNPNPR